MAKIFVWSDQHFNHDNMYKFTGLDGKRVRPQLDSAKEADEYMLDCYNDVVKPQDHVYWLGDVAINKEGIRFAKKFHGHKRLVLGNHDDHDTRRYHDVGFKKVRGLHRMGGLWLSHAPMHWGAEHSEERKGKIIGNVHGHIHEQPSPTPWHYNVCVEWTRYFPIELDRIIETMRKRKEHNYVL